MRTEFIDRQAWRLAESERSEELSSGGHPPKAGVLFAETALALAIPLIFALAANIWLGAS